MQQGIHQCFATRRQRLLEKIESNSIIILPSNNEVIRNGDTTHAFRQSSNFYYLTGFNEPNSLALLVLDQDKQSQFILFVRPKDPEKEQWDGRMAGLEGAKVIYQAHASYDIHTVNDVIMDYVKEKTKIYYSFGLHKNYDESVISWLNKLKSMQRRGVKVPCEIVNLDNILAEMRLIKDEYEQEMMRKAADITAAGHIRAMQSIALHDYQYEYQLEAELRHEFCKHGACQLAYNSIIGSGFNSCILHYNDNNNKFHANDLVLIDAGAEYNNYAADVTRTFPAGGKFTTEQRSIYELVLKAQLAAIAEIKPGNLWYRPQEVILEIITNGLLELGIINNSKKFSTGELIRQGAYRPFYMHNSGHWLGLDVHDVGQYKIDGKWREFEPGMALTVEPGIYIMENMPNVDKKWWNIGVRIEDDIIVTENGCEVLTQAAPKEVADIEKLMAMAG